MATKKKASASLADEPNAQTFTLVLEDLRSQFGVFGEALQGLREHMDTRFEAVDTRFEAVDTRFDAMDMRFEGVEGSLGGLDARLERTERNLGLVKTAVLDNSRELKAVGQAVAAVAAVVDQKVGRAEVVALVEGAVQKQRR